MAPKLPVIKRSKNLVEKKTKSYQKFDMVKNKVFRKNMSEKSEMVPKIRNLLSKIEIYCQKSKFIVENRNLLSIDYFLKTTIFTINRHFGQTHFGLCQKIEILHDTAGYFQRCLFKSWLIIVSSSLPICTARKDLMCPKSEISSIVSPLDTSEMQ